MRPKQLAAEVLYRFGLMHFCGWWRRMLGIGGPIFLMGHRVLTEDAARRNLIDRMALVSGHAITPEELRRRLSFVRRFVMPAGDPGVLACGLRTERCFYLTFDDGYVDNLTHGRPVLDALGIKAVIFFVGRLIEQPDAVPWWDGLGGEALAAGSDPRQAVRDYGILCARRKQEFKGLTDEDLTSTGDRRYVSEAELLALPDTFYAGNHTASHADLSRVDMETLVKEVESGDAVVRRSRRYLPVFAFPFGYFSRETKGWLRDHGRYPLAVATGNGIDGDPQCQRRINLNLQPFSFFAAHCVGLMR